MLVVPASVDRCSAASRKRCLSFAKTCALALRAVEGPQEEQPGSDFAVEFTHEEALVGAGIVDGNDVAGASKGTSTCSPLAAKLRPLIGAS